MFAGSTSTWSLPREKSLTRLEVRKILSIARESNARDYVFFATSANTGLRLCEVVHIKASDIQDGRLRITRRKKKRLVPQWIDISRALWSILSEWNQMFSGEEFIFPGVSSPCLIRRSKGQIERTCDGRHVARRNIQRKWAEAVRGVGLSMKGRGIHSLRHYAVSQFYEKTRDLRACQMFAGHSSSTITERYAHVLEMRDRVNSVEPVI